MRDPSKRRGDEPAGMIRVVAVMRVPGTGAAIPPLLTAALAVAAGCARHAAPTAAEGQALYAQNGCAGCHGQSGRGDGPVAPTLTPRPTNLHDAAAFTHGVELTAIAATIANGVPAPATSASENTQVVTHHGKVMPAFGHLTEVERQSLALYVMSLRNESR
jgi:high-affinity iron transporter